MSDTICEDKITIQSFAKSLIKFLKAVDVPFAGTLRNSQNYIKAADTGVGIFEMPLSEVKADMKEWEPLLHWVEGKRVLK